MLSRAEHHLDLRPNKSTYKHWLNVMILFVALQWLDFLSTLLGFSLGASELSPVVRTIAVVTGPTLGVFVAKVLTTVAMVRMSKRQAIVRAGNLWYSGIVVWNLVIISKLIGDFHRVASGL